MHATDFLKNPAEHANVAVAVLFGAEMHLRTQSRKALVRVLCGDCLLYTSDAADE